MQVIVEIQAGPDAGRRIEVRPGQQARIGRYAAGNTVVLQDPMVSTTHFSLECDEQGCTLRDLGSRWGTQVNKVKVTEAVLKDGDQILAGDTRFVVRFVTEVVTESPLLVSSRRPEPVSPATPRRTMEAPAPVPAPVPPAATIHDRVLKILREQKEPLYAILDAARDPLILTLLLTQCQEQYQSLYEGPKGEQLAAAAPYLVRLPAESPFLETVVRQGWGNSWGIYLTCPASFAEVRKHFRHFLLVKLEGDEEVYFRFYDPRVLRVYLPTCTVAEIMTFFGPISSFLLETKPPDVLLKCAPLAAGLQREEIALA